MADQVGYTMYFDGHWKSISKGDNGDALFLTAGVPDWRPIVAGDIPDLSGTYQPLDSDLTAFAAIAGVNGDILYYDSGWKALVKADNGDVLKLSAGLPTWQAEGGGAAHNFLSATHSDVVAAAAARGAVVVGDATPNWARVTVGSNLDVLATDGTDTTFTALGAAHIQSGTLDAARIPDLSGTYSILAHTHAVYLNKDGSVALTANWDAGGFEIRAQTFESDVVTGTPPLVVASQTVVANLNVSLLEGNAAVAFAAASHNHSGVYQPLDADLTAIAGISGVNGDILYYNSGWLALAKGSDTEVLTLASGLPSWAAPGGGAAAWESAAGVFRPKDASVVAGDQIYIKSKETSGGDAFKFSAGADFTAGKLLSVGDNEDVAYSEKFSLDYVGNAVFAGSVRINASDGLLLEGFSERIYKTGSAIGFRVNSGWAYTFGSQLNGLLLRGGYLKADNSYADRFKMNATTAISVDHQTWLSVQDNGTPRFEVERINAIQGSEDTAINIGGYYLWVDVYGKLRILDDAPTGDQDGELVGTQTI